MRLDARSGYRGSVIDLETGQPVRKVIWVDCDLGLLEAYQVDSSGNIKKDSEGNYLTYTAKGRFKWVPGGPAGRGVSHTTNGGGSRGVLGAPTCVKCGNVLTLPGDDLCIACYAKDRMVRMPTGVKPVPNPLLQVPCSHSGCNRPASWSVSDEVEASASVDELRDVAGNLRRRKIKFHRGAAVQRRYYCSFHWKAPKLLDKKGEVVEVQDEGFGVRPS